MFFTGGQTWSNSPERCQATTELGWLNVWFTQIALEKMTQFVLNIRVSGLWGLPWRANDEHVGFDLRLCLFRCLFCSWFVFFLSTREHKTLVLVLTVSNRIVCSQNSWSVNSHTGTHVHFVCLRVQTNTSCDDTSNGWEDRNEDKDTMSTGPPFKVSRALDGSRNLGLFFPPAAHLWGLSCSPP